MKLTWKNILIAVLAISGFSASYADNAGLWNHIRTQSWFNPVFTLVGGDAFGRVGQSQSASFAPLDLCSYTYSNSRGTSDRLYVGFFIGNEIPVAQAGLYAVDLGVGFYRPSPFSAGGNLSQGADAVSASHYNYSYQVLTQQLLVESKLLWKVREIYFPYLSLGVGASFNKSYGYNNNVPPFLEYTPLFSANSQTQFSYSVGVGIDRAIAKEWRVGAGYRFADLGKEQLGRAVLDTMPIANTLRSVHTYANEVFVQVSYIPTLNKGNDA